MACGWPAPSSAGMHRQKGEKILMYDRENDNRNNEGRQVQQELEDQLQKLTDKFGKDIDKLVEAKSKEIMTV